MFAELLHVSNLTEPKRNKQSTCTYIIHDVMVIERILTVVDEELQHSEGVVGTGVSKQEGHGFDSLPLRRPHTCMVGSIGALNSKLDENMSEYFGYSLPISYWL